MTGAQPFLLRLGHLRAEYQKQIEALADDVRERLVVPLCEKHDLSFLAGNGDYAFYRRGYKPGSLKSISELWCITDCEENDDLRRGSLAEFTEVFKALRAEVDGHLTLGMYVCRVKHTKRPAPIPGPAGSPTGPRTARQG